MLFYETRRNYQVKNIKKNIRTVNMNQKAKNHLQATANPFE